MIESSHSLYKLIVLYILEKTGFPMTNAQIAEIFLSGGYTTYFRLQEVLMEMADSSLLSLEEKNKTTYYSMTDQGKETLNYFENEISPEIRREISNYLVLHSYQMRNESAVSADYFRSSGQDYVVNCLVKEGSHTLIELKLTVPTEKAAEKLAVNWRDNAQECYAEIMKILSR